MYANYDQSSKWSEHVRAARTAGIAVDHYWFNGRMGTVESQITHITGTYDGIKIESNETLWWDVESEGSMPHWTPNEVVTYAKALEAAGIPISRQGIYLSSSVTRAADWSPVVALGMRLWVADYGLNNGEVSSKPLVGYWKDVELFQYTSVGKLPGYSGNLDLNITGKDVWTVYDMQVALNKIMGASLVPDGDYGRATSVVVSDFQKRYNLSVDGVAGTKTLTKLESLLSG